MLSNSPVSQHQKRESSSQPSEHQQPKHQLPEQPEHQHGDQSKQLLERQRQQNRGQHQQGTEPQQPKVQPIRSAPAISPQEVQTQHLQSSPLDATSFTAPPVPPKPHVLKASESHGRVLFNLAKMYSDEIKYSGENDSWNFKLTIFHDMCARAEVPEAIKLMAFSIMLKGFALDYYYSNVSTRGLALNFVQACVLINIYFENAEYKRNVLIK